MVDSIFPSPMLIGVCASFGFLAVRTICLFLLYNFPTGVRRDDAEETTPLLPHSEALATYRLSASTRTICGLGALTYVCLVMLAAYDTFLEYGQPAVQDVRFAIFRGGEVAYGLLVLSRTTFDVRHNKGQEMRTDSLSLVLLPWTMKLINTPASSRLIFGAVDWVVTPAIGLAILVASMHA
ncbi:hypothetical protein DFH06DRAFT_604073 [Mycena polygramma]|nr:hypothetical protein DFH06DRAFT_604073 [Mycena polygramma]